jgi:hypothetical protein
LSPAQGKKIGQRIERIFDFGFSILNYPTTQSPYSAAGTSPPNHPTISEKIRADSHDSRFIFKEETCIPKERGLRYNGVDQTGG